MPALRYKYCMNEPFLEGDAGKFATSHEQIEHKKKFIYKIGVDDDEKKDLLQQKEEL